MIVTRYGDMTKKQRDLATQLGSLRQAEAVADDANLELTQRARDDLKAAATAARQSYRQAAVAVEP
jgi:hypothetical protein